MGINLKLLDKESITNRKYINALYNKYSVDIGKPFHYAFPLDLAIQLFGEGAEQFLYEVGQGLCVCYGKTFEGKYYVDVTGFHLMKAYRGVMLYREMVAKWYNQNEVLENDSNGKCCKSNSITNKNKKITKIQ